MNIFYGLDVVVKNSIDFEMIKVINYWKVKNKEEEEEEDENDIDVQIGINNFNYFKVDVVFGNSIQVIGNVYIFCYMMSNDFDFFITIVNLKVVVKYGKVVGFEEVILIG